MCHEWFTLTSCSGYQALSNADVCERVNASVMKPFRPGVKFSTWMGDHLAVACAKFVFLFDRNAHISRYRHKFSFHQATLFQSCILRPAKTQNSNYSLNRYRSS